ncbi:50S ribosomal protein L1 [Candidatus Falkowbacteria bacterium]|uniref:Large ribosomal subunit protein uL1 n=1 Tax=Candidatus Buchananbacteria bacterium CG10_big_fil_rev_8_21_14_0_10_33_19 TaxID=1974525 RepID=A0A2H0W360_9BACT|nr:50S ribosomal protein L1 [Candidatus Falkowbacteria bacterium]PIS05805.1 MAG: 50S ribosomal protein L1 [Candidatus Buchananbacteria bacterium CG10_big_fil_rev_8_21_14_0_10_33_19]
MKKVTHSTSKRFKEVLKKIDPKQTYKIDEAMELAKATSTVKFDAGVEVHVNLGINPKKSDQQIRSSVSLPNGTGKTVKVAVISDDSEQLKIAKEAGADVVGEADLIEEIKKGKVEFDVLVTTPSTMRILAPVAKILGPKGLMPNPKDGTVTQNIAEAVGNLKKGKVGFKNDDSGNLHVMIGKVSFDKAKLVENFSALMDSIIKAKPSGAKGNYIKSISLSTTMGPGIKIDLAK